MSLASNFCHKSDVGRLRIPINRPPAVINFPPHQNHRKSYISTWPLATCLNQPCFSWIRFDLMPVLLGGIHLLLSQNFGIWTPSPPCLLYGLNHKTKFTQPCLLRSLLGTLPPPPLCERNKWLLRGHAQMKSAERR